MSIEIVIPRLGWNMEEGVFVGWLKQDGDQIRPGEPIFSLETDKSVQEVESEGSGCLEVLPDGPSPGQRVPVGLVIGRLLTPTEERRSAPGSSRIEATASVPVPTSASTEPEKRGTVPTPRISGSERIIGSPRARRRARELGVTLTSLTGTGRGGRIRERDVLAAASSAAVANPSGPIPAEKEFESLPIDPIRRRIAERMTRSVRETAPVTMSTSVDATNLVNLRRQFKAVASSSTAEAVPVVGFTDVVIKLLAMALTRHRVLNSRWDGERILIAREIHIGISVDTNYGLVVPVIRDVPGLTLRQVAAQSRDLAERARRRALRPEEMRGGTFTVTNLGALGVEVFTPIINHPECAILGMGRILDRRSSPGARLKVEPRMTLCLTFDHRIVDGAPAARFLQELGGLIENPGPWLLT